jgi:hypothetical protein
MDVQEKEKQIQETEFKAQERSDGKEDYAVMVPEPVPFVIGGKTYNLLPLKLSEMRLLIKLSGMEVKSVFGNKEINLVIDCVSTILKEPDVAFLEANLDVPTLTALFKALDMVNYTGIPKAKPGEKTNPN